MKKVSCLCPTYNRIPDYKFLIEETINSFILQDYPNKELIIINDTPEQTLEFNHPDVVVINLPRRCTSLGEKYNLGVTQASGDLLCTWEDDDIMLPWRLSKRVEVIGDLDYWNPKKYWFVDNGKLSHDHPIGVGHNGSIFTRKAFDLVGGYPHVSGGQDTKMDYFLQYHPQVKKATHDLIVRDWFYIYRWGIQPVHLSGIAPHDPWYKEIGNMKTEKGHFRLESRWQKDYVKYITDYMRLYGL